MHVGVVPMFNFMASSTLVAAIHRHCVLEHRPLAIESLGKGAGNLFKAVEIVAIEEIAMRQTASLQ
jgi:hypothetical protein